MPDAERDDPPLPPPRAGGLWRVRLLGTLEIRNGDLEVAQHLNEAHKLILLRLLMAPRSAHPRTEVAREVWPNSDRSDARLRNDVSKRVSEVRKLMEPRGFRPAQAILDDGTGLRLNAAAFEVDVDRFETLVRRRRWAEARALYGGELLPGFETPAVQQRRQELASLLERVDKALEQGLGLGLDDDDEAPPADEPRGIVAYTTAFYGRAEEIARLGELVARHRLVVVHGAPGTGKSRTVSEARKTEFGAFEQVFRAALEDCRSTADALDAVRVAVGAQPLAGGPLRAIATRLRGARTLLMLDDFERLAGPVGNALLDLLLEKLPQAHLVVTTRRALRRADATLVAHGPLPLPPKGESAEAAAAHPAVALFEDRARGVRANFSVNARNAATVVEICRLVDGVPLALELAGAMLHRLPLPALLAELQRGSRLLKRAIARGDRHDSIDMALGLSWRLLSPPARQLLRALSVFRGGFTVDQAQAVSGMSSVRKPLAELARDALLVNLPTEGGAPRLGLLGPVRDHAGAGIGTAEGLALRQAHRDVFAGVALGLFRRHGWPTAADHANVLAAMANALADGDAPCAARLALALGPMWRARGAGSAELQLLDRLAATPALKPRRRSLLLALLTALKVNAGLAAEARTQAAQALKLAGRDRLARAEALLAQAYERFLSAQDGEHALALVLQAEGLVPQRAPRALRVRWMFLRGALATVVEGRHQEALDLAREADALCNRVRHDPRGALLVLPLRVAALFGLRDLETALHLCLNGGEEAESLGMVSVRQQLFNRQALVLAAMGRHTAALEVLQQQAREAVRHGATYHATHAVWNQPEVLLELGRHEDAAVLMGFAHRYWLRQFEGLTQVDGDYLEAVRAAVIARHDAAAWKRWWARGRRLPEREGLARACGPGRAGPDAGLSARPPGRGAGWGRGDP